MDVPDYALFIVSRSNIYGCTASRGLLCPGHPVLKVDLPNDYYYFQDQISQMIEDRAQIRSI
jgi:hypothetical protein